jgi:hypothetical protein
LKNMYIHLPNLYDIILMGVPVKVGKYWID